MELEELQSRLGHLRHLESRENGPETPQKAYLTMEDSEKNRYIEFLIQQKEERDKTIADKDAFIKDQSLQVTPTLRFDLMNDAAQALFNYIDFTSFSKLHTDVKTNNCTITHAQWTQIDEHKWVFTITANRFLRNMVRAIVGTLLQVGSQKITIDDFKRIIESKDRCQAGTSAPAHALYLTDVTY